MNLETIIKEIGDYQGPQVKFMEVCGTHTASIFKNGIKSLLTPQIKLISGPGCPVCVTPSAYIDKAIEWAKQSDCVLQTFGDMMKVPGMKQSLSEAKAEGANVEIMYSPHEVLKKAEKFPAKTFVIACVGFETTIPVYSLLIQQLEQNNITNVKLLTVLRQIMPALEFICSTDSGIDAFIAPGHATAILGSDIYRSLALKYKKPFAVAGFEAEHVLIAIFDLLKQLEKGKNEVHNLYPSVVRPEGNKTALETIDYYFTSGPAYWRGIGVIENSGLYLNESYRKYDAGSFDLTDENNKQLSKCRCGEVILGKINPDECSMFGTACTPVKAKGPCMVSTEGTCGIWYRFSKKKS
ncbi:MAG: Hydrogenase isoenzymes formation protein HypD [Candidatus Dichloromethanomonas elyunquensis]|nr:MAG: Hydrogenase isoenzymes formation protein HypD [Candidatus Dichloromethanomonas elyunquensis]